MTSICCPHCRSVQRLSFWELHARLGQCYEMESAIGGRKVGRSDSEGFASQEEVPPSSSPGVSISRKSVRLPSSIDRQHIKPPSEEVLPDMDPSPANSNGQGSLPLSSYRRPVGVVPSPMSPEDMSVAILNTGRRASLQHVGHEHRDRDREVHREVHRSHSRGSGGLHRNELHGHHGRKRSILDSGGGERRSRDSDLLGSHKVGDIAKAVATLEDAALSSKDFKQLLQPHECWQKAKSSNRAVPSMRTGIKSNPSGVLGHTTSAPAAEEERGPARGLARFVLLPGRPFRNSWDILAVLFLVHDMIVIPLRFFDMPNALFLEILAWFTQVFWNFDILATFITGYYEDGNLILEPVKIAWNYTKTWLIFDVTVVSIDWIILFLAADSDAQGVHRLSKTVRLLRFLRMVRILRLAKISRMSEAVQEQIQSQSANIHYSLFKSIFRLLLLTHLLACSWYGIGRLSGEEWGDHSWVKEVALTERTLGYQYTTCYHWAFCQMGVGGIAIYPTNTYERSFGIFSAFIALMTFSTLVSKMTSLMSSLNKLKDEETEQFRLLRRYLIYNDIPLHLSQRIIRFLQHGYRIRNEALSAGSHLPILDLLSQSLQGELQLERHRGCLIELHFIQQLPAESRQTVQVMQKLAMNALGDTVVAHDDVLFCGGDSAEAAYFVQSGRLTYHCAQDDDDDDASIPVLSHTWVAEMSLWTPWTHMGDLISEDVSRVVVLHMEQFCKCVRESGECQPAAVAYAKDYVDQLRRKVVVHDLWSPRGEAPVSKLSRQTSMKSAQAGVQRCCRFWRTWNTNIHPMNG